MSTREREREANDTVELEVPAGLFEEVSHVYDQRGFNEEEQFILCAIQDAINPVLQLPEEAEDDLEEGREQRERGETTSHEELLEEYNLTSAVVHGT